MATVIREVLANKEAEITGKRYCTSCQWTQPLAGGEKRGTRWVCGKCLENRRLKRPSSIYSKGR